MIPPRLREIGGPLGVVFLCLALILFGLAQLISVERSLREGPPAENMLRVISQTQVELLKLDATIWRHELDDPAVGVQFERLADLLGNLSEPPQRQYLRRLELDGKVAEQTDAVLALDPILAQRSDAWAISLSEALGRLLQTLHSAADQSATTDWEDLSDRLQSYRAAVLQVLVALAFGLAAAAYLGWRVWADQRSLLNAVNLAQQLRQQRKQAEYWKDFASVISHQFRTPLAVIDSSAQRIVGGAATSDSTTERVQTIRSTVADLSRLVDAILLAGQLENGTKTARCARHDLIELGASIVSNLRARYPDKEIRLDVDAESLVAWFDPSLLVHCLLNLVDNALLHAGPPVVLRLYAEGEQAVCSISDSGPGISEAELGELFNKFRRGASTNADGSGLGLWIAKQLAELQGATIDVRSLIGEGTTFSVRIPAQGPEEIQQ